MVGVPTSESDYSAEVFFGRNGLAKVLESLFVRRISARPCGCTSLPGTRSAEIAAKLGQPQGNVRHDYYTGLGAEGSGQVAETDVWDYCSSG